MSVAKGYLRMIASASRHTPELRPCPSTENCLLAALRSIYG
jgi:hypothetical protein